MTAAWILRATWLVLPLTLGPALADSLDEAALGLRNTASVGLWVLWSVGLVAVLIPHPLSLTVVRMGGPATATAAIWAAVTTDEPVWAIVGITSGLLVGVSALSAPVGDLFVNGASYGDERRFLLRGPGPVVLLLGPLAWVVAILGSTAGPLLLADSRWVVGTAACVIGFPLVALAVRATNQLTRRWVVLVPAGLVLHDHLALAEPTLLARASISSIGPARPNTDALDLSQAAHGMALEVACTEPHEMLIAKRNSVAEVQSVSAFLFTPTRPDALLVEAERRRLSVG
ncbi:MAG TPA: hypothetical protein DF783_00960 [Acidimicrobiaceae bacterium]|jgi:hypothetical protein|nr:hypothetical protein [Acidimicrobiaceae bacterium]HCV35469.1 hypothetical protein [Acidimicrobiaceae bacterium]|tara:strand:- start:3171 stop:4031 length:861 start_codon:yes stop_codon:yes gene_type:complete